MQGVDVVRLDLVHLHGECRFRFGGVNNSWQDGSIPAAVLDVTQSGVVLFLERKVGDFWGNGAAQSAVDVQTWCGLIAFRGKPIHTYLRVCKFGPCSLHAVDEFALLPCPIQSPVIQPSNWTVIGNSHLQVRESNNHSDSRCIKYPIRNLELLTLKRMKDEFTKFLAQSHHIT